MALRARAPALEPLRGGELILIDTRLLVLIDSRLTLEQLAASMVSQGIGAAALQGEPDALTSRVFEENGIPFLLLPNDAQLEDVEQQVLRYIVDRRAQLHERAQDLHRQLSELALAGRGIKTLLARLSELLGLPVILERGKDVEFVSAGPVREPPAGLRQALADQRSELEQSLRGVPLSAFDPPVVMHSLPGGRARLVAPILVHGAIGAFLSIVGEEAEIGEVHRLALGRAAHACAIELVRLDAARDARDELEDELLDALVGQGGGSQRSASERARRKGLDLESPYLVVAGQPQRSERIDAVRAAWESALHTARLPALTRSQGGRVMALVGFGKKALNHLRPLLDRLHAAGGQASGAGFALGYASLRTTSSEAAAAAREAEQALSMGMRLFGPDALAAFSDLGLYRLLYGLQGTAQLKTFCHDTLEPLLKRDRNGVLLETLEAYLSTNGSPTEAAQLLHLHRNTVLYRLERIQELLGVSLKDSEARLTLHLAVKARHVLEEVWA